MEISQKEQDWLKDYFPGLAIVDEGEKKRLRGTLSFTARYDKSVNQIEIFPSKKSPNDPWFITDSYEIEILFPENSSFPITKEIGGRILQIKNSKKIESIADLHINKEDGTCCLFVLTELKDALPHGYNLIDYLKNLVVPFFYAQSYFENHNEWPWGQYSHGELGIIESYLSKAGTINDVNEIFSCLKATTAKEKYLHMIKFPPKGHWECPCGSMKKFRNCHPIVLAGIRKLREDINKLVIK